MTGSGVQSVAAWLLAHPAAAGTGVLVRLISAQGYGARWPGQLALVDEGRVVAGSLLGGALDELVEDLDGSAEPLPRLHEQQLDPQVSGRFGLATRGRVRLLMEPVSGIDSAVWQVAADRRTVVLLTDLERLTFTGTHVHAEPVGPSGWPAEAREVAADLARGGGSADVLVTAGPGSSRVLVSAYAPQPMLLVVGSGAAAAALVAQAALLGWAAVVTDDEGRVPDLCRDLRPADSVVVLVSDRDVEAALLLAAMRSEAGFVGALGPRFAQEERVERLVAGGAEPAEIARLRLPVGLDIGAGPPAEIAVACVAEILAVRSGRAGRPLREGAGHLHGPTR